MTQFGLEIRTQQNRNGYTVWQQLTDPGRNPIYYAWTSQSWVLIHARHRNTRGEGFIQTRMDGW